MSGKNRIDRLFLDMELAEEVTPGKTLIEVIGNSRVLIEKQLGVCGYNHQNITIKVPEGIVSIKGDKLELQQMTREHVVITGVISGITLREWR